jgi:multiple sugar transport system ATP-binding protein
VAAITLAGISKSFGAFRVLHDVTLALAAGEHVTLLGPSGCGKTVLLRIIAGLDRPDGGTIAFDGRDVTRLPARQRGAGLVSADRVYLPYTEPTRTLWSYFRRPVTCAEDEVAARLVIVRDVLGDGAADQLRHTSGRPPTRHPPSLAVAGCLSRGARVLLLDDPLAAVTTAQRADERKQIGDLLRRFDTTAVYATHDRAEAASVGDRIVLMRDGRIEQIGRYEELYRRPATTFVAGFAAARAMNLLSGVIAPDGVRLVATSQLSGASAGLGWTIPLPPPGTSQLPPGTALTLGIRAEALRLAADGEDGVLVRVLDVGAPMAEQPPRHLVTCALGSAAEPGPVLVAELALPAGMAPSPDAPLRLAFDADQVHLFDAAGTRIDEITSCR